MPQAGQEATSTDKPITECPKNMSEAGYRCICLRPHTAGEITYFENVLRPFSDSFVC